MRRGIVALLGLCALAALAAPALLAAWRQTEQVAGPNSERTQRSAPELVFDDRGGALAWWDLTDRRERKHTLERAYRSPGGRWRALPRVNGVREVQFLPNGGGSIVGLLGARTTRSVPIRGRLEAVFAASPDRKLSRQRLAVRADVFQTALAANRHRDAVAVFRRGTSIWAAVRRDGGRFRRAAKISTDSSHTTEVGAAMNEGGDALVTWFDEGRVLASWRAGGQRRFTPPIDLGFAGDLESFLATDVADSGDAVVAWKEEFEVDEGDEDDPGRVWAAAGSLRSGFAERRLLAGQSQDASDPTVAFDASGRGIVAWVTHGSVRTADVRGGRIRTGERLRARGLSLAFPSLTATSDGSLWLEANGYVTRRPRGAARFQPLRLAVDSELAQLAVDPRTGGPAIVNRREVCPCNVGGRDVSVIEVVRP